MTFKKFPKKKQDDSGFSVPPEWYDDDEIEEWRVDTQKKLREENQNDANTSAALALNEQEKQHLQEEPTVTELWWFLKGKVVARKELLESLK